MAEAHHQHDRNGRGRRLNARDLAEAARETIEELTDFPVEAVSGLQWDGEHWVVSVDARELERVPKTTDVMATYQVELDEGGHLLGYQRTRRYQRGQAEGG
jgi:hypothetical protein